MKGLLQKAYLRFSSVNVVHSTPGRVRLQIPGLKKVPKDLRYLEEELVEMTKLRPGLKDMSLCYITGRALLHYDCNLLDEKEVVDWIGTIWHTFGEVIPGAKDNTEVEEIKFLIEASLKQKLNLLEG